MPRPGPRPYECIRRAWHSESHQALRGGLTQEIFRIVTEFHRADTRCKKEWQEKLPIVVLRAEEILYSKARTEAEYADLSTLKERLNDAVNTMIRRTDESREKEASADGPFMEPCVEAALSLGCAPKMNPRGLRSCSARISHSSLRRTNPVAATTTTTTTTCSSSSSSTSAHSCCSSSPSSTSVSSSSAAVSIATSSATITSTTSCITTSPNQPQALAFLSLESSSSWQKPRPVQVQVHAPSLTPAAEALPSSKPRPPCFATSSSNMVNNPHINFPVTELQKQQHRQQNLGFNPNLAPLYPLAPPSFRLQQPEQLPALTGSDLKYLHNHHLQQRQQQQQHQQQQQQHQKFQHQQQSFQQHQHPPYPNFMVYIPQVQASVPPPSRHPSQTSLPAMFPSTSLESATIINMQPRIPPAIQLQDEHDLDLCLAPPKATNARPKCNIDSNGRHLADTPADDILSSTNATTLKKAKIARPH